MQNQLIIKSTENQPILKLYFYKNKKNVIIKKNKNFMQIPETLNDLKKTANLKNGAPVMPKEIRTFGQKAADKVTGFCGSWTFIISVLTYIAIWVTLNLTAWTYQWDPWPFIILNLTLSCLASLQAPVILMSQNRQNQKDRLNQRYDYLIDRKSSRDIEKLLKEVKDLKKQISKIKF